MGIRTRLVYLTRHAAAAAVPAKRYRLDGLSLVSAHKMAQKKASQKKTIGISVIRFCKGMKTGPRTKVAVTNSACFGVRCLANKYKKMIVPRLNMDMSR